MVFKEEDRYCNCKLRQINTELALKWFYINNNGSTDNNCSNTVRLNLKGKAGGKFS